MRSNICVVGMGYVGLPLAVAFDAEGYDVTGFDISRDVVDREVSVLLFAGGVFVLMASESIEKPPVRGLQPAGVPAQKRPKGRVSPLPSATRQSVLTPSPSATEQSVSNSRV